MLRFNPRTHEGCDVLQRKGYEYQWSFNPRTHEGCDLSWCSVRRFTSSFNPRTHEGCDMMHSDCSKAALRFNPRTHEGCDVWQSVCVAAFQVVSIHAPTRGATSFVALGWMPLSTFQSTHPRGVRLSSFPSLTPSL